LPSATWTRATGRPTFKAARSFDQLKLAESEEIKNDRAYLEKTADQLRAETWSFQSGWQWAVHPSKS
jgi:hypothetical protein